LGDLKEIINSVMLGLSYTWKAFSKIAKHYCRNVENTVLIARDTQNTPE
jgi:hypothetical protein